MGKAKRNKRERRKRRKVLSMPQNWDSFRALVIKRDLNTEEVLQGLGRELLKRRLVPIRTMAGTTETFHVETVSIDPAGIWVTFRRVQVDFPVSGDIFEGVIVPSQNHLPVSKGCSNDS